MTAVPAAPRLTPARVLDLIERAVVIGLYAFLAWRLIGTFRAEGGLMAPMLLLSEGLVIYFMLTRRRTEDVSLKPTEWALAVGATALPMTVMSGGAEALAPAAFTVPLMVSGLLMQFWAKVTLARSFGILPANRGVKRHGPYAFLRHPMYAGYLVTHVAFLLSFPLLWNVAVYGAALTLQVFRLLAEERLLARDESYREFQAAVRWRLLPGVF